MNKRALQMRKIAECAEPDEYTEPHRRGRDAASDDNDTVRSSRFTIKSKTCAPQTTELRIDLPGRGQCEPSTNPARLHRDSRRATPRGG